MFTAFNTNSSILDSFYYKRYCVTLSYQIPRAFFVSHACWENFIRISYREQFHPKTLHQIVLNVVLVWGLLVCNSASFSQANICRIIKQLQMYYPNLCVSIERKGSHFQYRIGMVLVLLERKSLSHTLGSFWQGYALMPDIHT